MPVIALLASPLVRKIGAGFLALAVLYSCYLYIYNRGAAHERGAWNARVAAETAKNASETVALQGRVDDYAKRLATAQAAREKVVTVYRDRIVAAEYPDCRVTDQVMTDRNAIRLDETLPDAP